MLAHWDESPGDAVPQARADLDHPDPRPGPTAPTATLELSSQLVLKATEDFQVFPMSEGLSNISEGLFCPTSWLGDVHHRSSYVSFSLLAFV